MASAFGTSVYIRVTPRPRNLADSREILNVLRHFGDVVSFKHNKQEPNLVRTSSLAHRTFMATFRSSNASQELINASPLTFTLAPLDGTTSTISVEDEAETPRAGPPSTQSSRPDASSSSAATSTTHDDPSILDRPSAILSERETAPSSPGWGEFDRTRQPSRTPGPSPLAHHAAVPTNPARNRHGTLADGDAPRQRAPAGARRFRLDADVSRRDNRRHVARNVYHDRFETRPGSLAERALAAAVPLPGLHKLAPADMAPGWVLQRREEQLRRRRSVREMMAGSSVPPGEG